MAFVFSLQALLNLRHREEEREERLLGEVLQRANELRRTMARIDAELAAVTEMRVSGVMQSLRGSELQASYARYVSLKEARVSTEEQMEQIEQLRRRQTESYGAARRAREMVQELKTRQHEAYQIQVARAEQKALDDGFLMRRRRTRQELPGTLRQELPSAPANGVNGEGGTGGIAAKQPIPGTWKD